MKQKISARPYWVLPGVLLSTAMFLCKPVRQLRSELLLMNAKYVQLQLLDYTVFKKSTYPTFDRPKNAISGLGQIGICLYDLQDPKKLNCFCVSRLNDLQFIIFCPSIVLTAQFLGLILLCNSSRGLFFTFSYRLPPPSA